MIRNLPCPSREDVQNHLITAFGSQGRSAYDITNTQLDYITMLYDTYDALSGAPDDLLKGTTLDEALRSAIRSAYDLTQSGRILSSLRTSLMSGIEQCPTCGISPPSELDHHLPKSIFHPLSIYVRNLIPMCGICNNKKGNYISDAPEQHFIHPYFDELPHNRFMRANVSTDGFGLLVEYEVDPDSDLPNDLKRRLAHQLLRLNLNERYASEINVYLLSHTTSLHQAYQSGGAAKVSLFLDIQSQVEFGSLHQNHWRPVLLSSLKQHAEFCDGGFSRVLPLPDGLEIGL